jgi:hypothetical protein
MANIKDDFNQVNPKHKEGRVATKLEQQTAKVPSDVFLWASLGSMVGSLTLKTLGKDETALFVGQWAPAFLLFGIYNKMVKQRGHD